MVREIRSLRRRVCALEERVEVQQETIVESVQRSWMRDSEYERLLRERNRLQARVSNLEDEIRRRRVIIMKIIIIEIVVVGKGW